MKILIVVPKYNLSKEQDYDYDFPLGLAYISSTLTHAGYEVDCLNSNHYSGSMEELLIRKLSKKKYNIVCTGGNSLIYAVLKKIIDITRKYSADSTIILGGPAITSDPEFMFKLLKPDFAVFGEGEPTIIELLDYLKENKNFNNEILSKINGIIYKNKDDEVIKTQIREPIKDLEKIPLPDFEGLEFEKQIDHAHCNDHWTYQAFDYPRVYPMLSSRGCPFNCTFCWHPERYRARSIDDIIKELKPAIKKYKINNIMIYDDCFSANKERLYEFCEKIKKLTKELSCDLKWSCQLLVHTVDKKTLKIMKDAGCDNISYGFESFSPTILRSMRKPITPEQIEFALKETLKAEIGIQGNFIFGDIAETKETAKETLDWWKKNAQAQISLGFIQPYPGSDLYTHCLKKGIIKSKFDYIQNHVGPDTRLNMTDSMTDDEIKNLSKELLDLFRKYAKFIKPLSLKTMNKKEKTYEVNVKCPYCSEVNLYKNCFIENKYNYGFHLICRKCHLRFVVVSTLHRIAYKFYPQTRAIRNFYISLKNRTKKKRV